MTLDSRPRRPELDGLRGIAILMVLEVHFGLLAVPLGWAGLEELRPLFYLGWSGVDLFFVLSGFLLGGILLDNRGAVNYFKVFYVRRICRIFPLYYVIVIAMLLLPLPLVLHGSSPTTGPAFPWWTYATYTQNFAMAGADRFGSVWLSHTWSLAVEEQFYLLLPFLIFLFSPRRLAYVLAGLVVAVIAVRVAVLSLYPDSILAPILLLPTRGEPVLFGVLGALAVRNARVLALLQRRRVALYGLLGVLLGATVFAAVSGRYEESGALHFPETYGFTLVATLYTCAVLIAVTERRGPVSFVTRRRTLGWIGLIAYGTYLVHVPVKGLLTWFAYGEPTFETPETMAGYLLSLCGLLIIFGLAATSWYLFERRIVEWGRSFLYAKGRVPTPAVAAGAGTTEVRLDGGHPPPEPVEEARPDEERQPSLSSGS